VDTVKAAAAAADDDDDDDAGFGGEAQYYGTSGPSSTNGYLDAGSGQYAQPDNSYNPSEYSRGCNLSSSSSCVMLISRRGKGRGLLRAIYSSCQLRGRRCVTCTGPEANY